MAFVSTYLHFWRNTEEAFNFYKSVFGGEFEWGIHRFGKAPVQDGMSEMSLEDKNLVMHVCLPILWGHKLMGTDAPDSMSFTLNKGNNMYISLNPDSLEEGQKLFDALTVNGKIETPLQKMFWGAYFASFSDQFGVQWMMNIRKKSNF